MKKYLLLCLLLPLVTFAQHSIQGQFSPAESFSFALLYHVTPSGTNYIEQAKTNTDGSWIINLNEDSEVGIYKIVYATPVEANNFDVFYNGKESISLTFDLETGLHFVISEENKLWQNYTDSIFKLNHQISDYFMTQKTDTSEITAIFKTLKNTQDAFEKKSSNMMVSPFIKSNRTYIPDVYEDVSTYSANLKKHYFDYMDFSNPLLLSSDFLNERVEAYVLAMPEDAHYYKMAIDDVVNATKDNEDAKIMILENLWKIMMDKQQPEVVNYISDIYLLPLAKATNNTSLIEALEDYNKSAIGKKATDFNFTYLENNKAIKTTLYNFNTSKNTLLIFWSSGCSHCLQELPKVKTLMENHPNITVLAYGLEDGVRNWNQTIEHFPSFIHTYDLKKWESPLIKAYGVSATPSYFVLDSDKIILAKPEHVEDLESYFNK
ncbi:Thiol-disulfide isomerase or thioredoxin [Bizionia echini]|uniref:Thiol-disulfide isomerase or thioredoxin n=1 Tax=Bizionia echini TaxID=649333 RepID=A0A1I4ZLQ2_9FLAO|nr:thioredoxin family protein [Bizionia echini]SFN51201.1 Thiol-disulfide isomerase or thioredoxin [Bizionia echini]